MSTVIFAILGIVVLYITWQIFMTIWTRISNLGVTHSFSSDSYFNSFSTSAILGIVLARAVWMIQNSKLYEEVPWALLPYLRTTEGVRWLTFMPWRLLALTEGMNLIILFVFTGIMVFLINVLPTIKHIRSLKIEKLTVKRDLSVKTILSGIIILSYFGLLVAYIILPK